MQKIVMPKEILGVISACVVFVSVFYVGVSKGVPTTLAYVFAFLAFIAVLAFFIGQLRYFMKQLIDLIKFIFKILKWSPNFLPFIPPDLLVVPLRQVADVPPINPTECWSPISPPQVGVGLQVKGQNIFKC